MEFEVLKRHIQGLHYGLTWSTGFCGKRGKIGGIVEKCKGPMAKKCCCNKILMISFRVVNTMPTLFNYILMLYFETTVENAFSFSFSFLQYSLSFLTSLFWHGLDNSVSILIYFLNMEGYIVNQESHN